MSTRSSLLLGFGMMALANIIGGATYPMQKLALEGLPPATVTLLRNLVALVPLAWLAIRARAEGGAAGFLGSQAFQTRSEWLRVLFVGVLAYGAPLLLGIVGTQYATAANASILLLVEPPTILFFSWLLLGERIRPRVVAGIALGLVGAGRIVFDGAEPGDLFAGEMLFGNLLLALHGLLWGLHTPVAKPLTARVDPFVLTTWIVLSSLVLLVPGAALEWRSLEVGDALGAAIFWSAALGIFGTVVALALWFGALRRIPASSVAPFLFLQPLVGVLAGVLWLDEPMTRAVWVGGAILMAGVLLTLGGGADDASDEPPSEPSGPAASADAHRP